MSTGDYLVFMAFMVAVAYELERRRCIRGGVWGFQPCLLWDWVRAAYLSSVIHFGLGWAIWRWL